MSSLQKFTEISDVCNKCLSAPVWPEEGISDWRCNLWPEVCLKCKKCWQHTDPLCSSLICGQLSRAHAPQILLGDSAKTQRGVNGIKPAIKYCLSSYRSCWKHLLWSTDNNSCIASFCPGLTLSPILSHQPAKSHLCCVRQCRAPAPRSQLLLLLLLPRASPNGRRLCQCLPQCFSCVCFVKLKLSITTRIV